jgi:hypothetical protein
MDHLLSRHDVLIIGRGSGRRDAVRTYTGELIESAFQLVNCGSGWEVLWFVSNVTDKNGGGRTAVVRKLRICKM